ncbi:MAG: hypothetical protein AAGF85_21805, partial [Bacteroidota bacterium]
HFESYLSMLEWEGLSSAEKQDRRRDILNRLLHAYKLKHGKPSQSHKYEEAIIEMYDVIINLEEQIDHLADAPDIALRLKGMMILEKYVVDKKLTFHGIRHLPIVLFKNILKQFRKALLHK